MDIKKTFAAVVVALTLIAVAPPLLFSQEDDSLPRRIVKWSEAEQTAWLNSYLSDGMPQPFGDALARLVLNKSSITLPLLEKKIEEILQSPSPNTLFANPTVDPEKVVAGAAAMIAYAGNEQALREIGKLMKIDEKRFGYLVTMTLANAIGFGNPFAVAYRGFAIEDPAVDTRINAWAEGRFTHEKNLTPKLMRQFWAEAMVDQYGCVPTSVQWAKDPIASRLNPAGEPILHDETVRLTVQAAQKRKTK